MNSEFSDLIDEMVTQQEKLLLKCARRIVPSATSEDVLQPNDFPELENNPHFRYEEGILAGMLTVQMAIKAEKNAQLHPFERTLDC